jgi:hypothetical protein
LFLAVLRFCAKKTLAPAKEKWYKQAKQCEDTSRGAGYAIPQQTMADCVVGRFDRDVSTCRASHNNPIPVLWPRIADVRRDVAGWPQGCQRRKHRRISLGPGNQPRWSHKPIIAQVARVGDPRPIPWLAGKRLRLTFK